MRLQSLSKFDMLKLNSIKNLCDTLHPSMAVIGVLWLLMLFTLLNSDKMLFDGLYITSYDTLQG